LTLLLIIKSLFTITFANSNLPLLLLFCYCSIRSPTLRKMKLN